MAVVLEEQEGAPAAYPTVTHWGGDFREPMPNDPVVSQVTTWQRLEAWINRRWATRDVVYIVEGPGEWISRLTPFTVTTTEIWTSEAWSSTTIVRTPLGLRLDGDGPYRITGTAGDGTRPPEAVLEAWRRLHEYQQGAPDSKFNEAAELGAPGGGEIVRGWAAKEMHLSGAGDLLRPYRELGR